MEQNTYPTVINATNDFLNTQITALQEAIERKDALIISLQDRSSEINQRSYSIAADLQRVRDNMHEWTMEALDEESITESQAEEIAEICGFELTKEFEVEVTVLYSLTINARTEEEAQNAVHDIDFDTVSYNDDNISWLTSSIDRVEI